MPLVNGLCWWPPFCESSLLRNEAQYPTMGYASHLVDIRRVAAPSVTLYSSLQRVAPSLQRAHPYRERIIRQPGCSTRRWRGHAVRGRGRPPALLVLAALAARRRGHGRGRRLWLGLGLGLGVGVGVGVGVRVRVRLAQQEREVPPRRHAAAAHGHEARDVARGRRAQVDAPRHLGDVGDMWGRYRGDMRGGGVCSARGAPAPRV